MKIILWISILLTTLKNRFKIYKDKFMLKNSLISFSLWGDNDFYCKGMLENAKLRSKIYPKWKIMVFHDSSVPSSILTDLRRNEVILVEKDNNVPHFDKSLWRFEAVDMTEGPVIFRDSDSRINSREKWAVNRWLQTDKSLHIIREEGHYKHIQAGMFGLKNVNLNMTSLISEWLLHNSDSYGKQIDQVFLKEVIWPLFIEDQIAHISNEKSRKLKTDLSLNISIKPEVGNFIGERIYEWG